jgi:sugar/nucleoside kinase (ribokinase family)
MKRYGVYAVGAALVDTEIEVDDADLIAMGVSKGRMTLVDEARQRELLEHLQGHLVKASRASGGSAANSVIAVAQFGVPSFLSCKVASDADGAFYLQDLRAAGVDHPQGAGTAHGTSGKCLVLITPDAERSMNSYLGISESLSTAELAPEAIASSEYLYLEGYQVTSTSGRAAAVCAREFAEQAGVKTALSFSDPGMVQYFREGMEILVGSGVDQLFCNEAEALAWARTDNIDEALASLRAIARCFVITRGADGALVFDGQDLHHIDAHPVVAIDSNGAGDMFAGAFLYALCRGEHAATAGRFASLAAGTVVSRYGPRLPAAHCVALRRLFFGS